MRPLAAALALTLAAAGCGGEPARDGASDRQRTQQRPPPPYALFDGTTFEPSAAAYDPATDRVLVLSDKDAILYRYQLTSDGRLVLPKGERQRELHLPSGDAPLKFESMTRLEDGRFLALTAFDRKEPQYRHLVRFRFATKGPVECEDLAFPADAILARLREVDPTIAYYKIEGLCGTKGDAAILVGIRSVGVSYKQKRDVAWVLRLPRREDDAGYAVPDAMDTKDLRGHVGREEGASDLLRDPQSGRFYMLTSYEDEAHPDRPEAHGGHLFLLADDEADVCPGVRFTTGPPGGPRDGMRDAIATFSAKSEGLALLPDGRLLVLFDDDTEWKTSFEGYEQSQGLFTIVTPPAANPPATAAPTATAHAR